MASLFGSAFLVCDLSVEGVSVEGVSVKVCVCKGVSGEVCLPRCDCRSVSVEAGEK